MKGPECCVCPASFDVVCDVSECGMLVCVTLSIKDLMRSKNTSGYFSFYVDNISI